MKRLILVLVSLHLSEGLQKLILKKGKSAQEIMKEKGVLEEFLKKHRVDPGLRYYPEKFNVVYEPITNYLNESTESSTQMHLLHILTRDRHITCTMGVVIWVGYDTVKVQNIIVHNQELGLSLSEPTHPFYYANFDGIFGMAYQSLAVGGSYPVTEQMLRQGQLSEPIFSFYFSRQPTFQYGGELILGGVDNQLFTGEIIWTPVTYEMYWQIAIEEFSIGNKATGWCSQGCQAIVDTGTCQLTIPQQYMESFLQAVGVEPANEDELLVDCNNVQNMPTITFVINGTQFPLPPSAYVSNSNGHCTVAIETTYVMSLNGEPLWIFGDVFLKEYYSIFDMANNRMGFAPSA